MTRSRSWAAGAALAVVLAALAMFAAPALLKWQAQVQLSGLLGRPVTVGDLSLRPWALEATLRELSIGAPQGRSAEPLLQVARVRANLALMPLLRGEVALEALDIEAPVLRLARVDETHWDIDDLLERFVRREAATGSPPRLSLRELRLTQGQVRLEDRPAGRVHEVQDLSLSLPALSNDPALAEAAVEPRLAMRLNGADVQAQASGTPLSAQPRGSLALQVKDLDLAPYAGYLPRSLPLRPVQGRFTLDLASEFGPADPSPGPARWSVRGQARAEDLALLDAAGGTPVAWRALDIELQDLQPLQRRLQLGSVRLEGAQLQAGRDAKGAWRLPGVQGPQAAATPSADASPWQVRVGRLEVVDAQLRWRDATRRPAAEWQVDAFQASARDLAWPSPQPVPFTTSARLRPAALPASAAARVQAEGEASDRQARVGLEVDGLELGTLAPYLSEWIVPRLQGRLALQGRLQWQAPGDAAGGGGQLGLELARVRLQALKLTPAGPARAPAAASLDLLELQDSRVDLGSRQLALGSVRLQRPALWLTRHADGSLNLERWLRSDATAPRAAPAPAARGPGPAPWRVTLQQLSLTQGQLHWRDEAAAGAAEVAELALRSLSLGVNGLDWDPGRAAAPARMQLRGQWVDPSPAGQRDTDTGWIDWHGRVGLKPLLAEGELRVQRLPATLFGAYFGPQLPVAIHRAEVGFQGRVGWRPKPDGASISVQGDALLADVHVATRSGPVHEALHATGEEELLSWQSLAIKRLDFAMNPGQRPRLGVGELAASDLYARLLVTETGRLNLQGVTARAAAPDAGAPSGPPAPAPVANPATGPARPLDVVIESTRLSNGRIDFNDRYIRPNYSAELTELHGELGTVSSDLREMARLQLRGRVAGTGLLEISGQLNPASLPPQLDLQARASDIELPPLSPYAAKYAGYAIERGKLGVNVSYRIDPQGRLQASNQVVLNQLTFGERVESPKATRLPVLLAVSLLKDRHGVIDVDLPISGSLNDPQFSLGGLIVKVIVNLLAKAVTAPFSLLFGAGDQDLGQVGFQPGTARLEPASGPALDKVARALLDRPGLHLTVAGTADPVLEREAFQREAVEARLQAERRRELQRQGPAAEASPALAPEDRVRLLKSIYAATELPGKPRNLLGMAKSLPAPEMEAMLRTNVPVNDEALRALALQRAVVVRDALLARGLPAERLFLSAPHLHGPSDAVEGWTPRAQLTLSAR